MQAQLVWWWEQQHVFAADSCQRSTTMHQAYEEAAETMCIALVEFVSSSTVKFGFGWPGLQSCITDSFKKT